MGDADPATPKDQPPTGGAPIAIGGSLADLGEQSIITDSQSSGLQTFSVEQTKLQQKAEADAHRRYMETERLKNEEIQKQHERKKDWIIFCLVVCAMAGGLILGMVLNFMNVDQESKRWGQSLIILILGALGGYITGSKAT